MPSDSAVAAGFSREQNANSQVGDHQGVQLLSDCRTAIREVDVELPELLP